MFESGEHFYYYCRVTNDETTLTLPELEIAEIRSFSGKEKEEEYVKAGVG